MSEVARIERRGSRASVIGDTPIDQPRIERAVREILLAIGEDPERLGLQETPARVARAWEEMTRGMRQSASDHLSKTFPQIGGDLVTLVNIDFWSLCEHHLLPFTGRAHIAYLPGHDKVVGLSKLARTVDVFARRPQIQERLTAQICDSLMEHLEPSGAIVVIEAEHLCMQMRGAAKHAARMRTVAHRGVFSEDRDARAEALTLLRSSAP